ncbi:MAG: transglutaminase TgpA family protein, partial [Gemmataceae bacterium]
LLATRHSSRATRWLLSFAPRWTLLVAGPALVLFLLTPRRDKWAWQPLNNLHSGYIRGHNLEEREEINLNRIGRIELDNGIALQVAAVDVDGQPKLDLSAEQRWRGAVLDCYEKGKWMMHESPPVSRRGRQYELPHFGPGQYFLTFNVPARPSGGLVLAEPIHFGPGDARLPVISLSDEEPSADRSAGSGKRLSRTPLFAEVAGTVLPQLLGDARREYRYRQVVPGRGDPARTPADEKREGNYFERLVYIPKPLRTDLLCWTFDLLRRLSRQSRYRLSEDVRAALAGQRDSFRIHEDDWEEVARVLTDSLANSGTFTYTLELTRQDLSIDPVLDFLINVKQGHCERFAAALALMLRSVGIPARLVKGYRGCDNLGEGQYLIRHYHAHAWVEILTPRSESIRSGDKTKSLPLTDFDWLTLDATPAESAAANRLFSLPYLWEKAQRICLQSWRSLIVEYNGDEQAGLWDKLQSGRLTPLLSKLALAVSALVAAAAAWVLLRRLRRLRPARGAVGPNSVIYQRLLRILGRHSSLRPQLAQTPREYGKAAQAFLQTRPALAALADVPLHVVALFYRARFGGRPPSAEENQTIHADLDRLAERASSMKS